MSPSSNFLSSFAPGSIKISYFVPSKRDEIWKEQGIWKWRLHDNNSWISYKVSANFIFLHRPQKLILAFWNGKLSIQRIIPVFACPLKFVQYPPSVLRIFFSSSLSFSSSSSLTLSFACLFFNRIANSTRRTMSINFTTNLQNQNKPRGK